MISALHGISPIISIDRNAETALHRQVYDGFRSAIIVENFALEDRRRLCEEIPRWPSLPLCDF
jgi:hypothetical protein